MVRPGFCRKKNRRDWMQQLRSPFLFDVGHGERGGSPASRELPPISMNNKSV